MATEDDSRNQSVTNFYKDSVVLITGGTGFVGKVLIEKLLRCFEVSRIYLLVREKKNAKAKERLRGIFDEPIFEVIKKSNATALSNVIPIDTDFEQDQIISEHDRELLLTEVTVVFNVMASVKFNENIETALDTNVTCSKKLFDMVGEMTHIKSIVHVSTFYSNCDRACIEEQIFDDIPFGGHENILGIFTHLRKHQKKQLTPFILDKMPNSYTFSKKCAEVMIQQRYSHLPIAIFRPPIVISAYREPVPGWVDNFNGIAGMCIPLTQGNAYFARGEPDFPSHSVPVDYCVAALIAVGADPKAVPGENVPVYNFATESNSVRWGEYARLIATGCQSRLGKIFGRYAIGVTNSRIFRFLFVRWFLLQAFVADLLLLLAGNKRRNLTMAKRVLALEEAACYFALHKWTFRNDNMWRILNGLSDKERKLLDFDIDQLNWKDYFRNFLPGIRAALDRSIQRRKSFGASG
ncbi:fatty acyl-CoA reductase wat-like [Toxorhynchites rutilus septentrionalis]|uniref:fatty acyl-CoA reductase wat-like n=1 Tax=Toxorhynchites rutilus septentrionalis TaxID=329112 RepID=UPI00247A6544|nr:fatty acyl-CoA reductase wat-like [Toxorhynchites rutilus septentrionalis]